MSKRFAELEAYRKHINKGRGILNATDLADALGRFGMAYNVRVEPDVNKYTGEKTGFFDTYRDDNNKKLGAGLMGRYTVAQNGDAFGIMDAFRAVFATPENPAVLMNPRIWGGGSSLSLDLDCGAFLVGAPSVGDTIMHRLTFKNSFDGSSNLVLFVQTFRILCGNGAAGWSKDCSFVFRHTASINDLLGEAFDVIRGASRLMKGTEAVYNFLEQTPMTRRQMERVAAKVWAAKGESKAAQKNAAEVIETVLNNFESADNGTIARDTAWNGFNAGTHYTTHEAPIRVHAQTTGSADLARAQASLGGSIAKVNAKLMAAITEELKIDDDITRILRNVETSQVENILRAMEAPAAPVRTSQGALSFDDLMGLGVGN